MTPTHFKAQVALLLDILPLITPYKQFALKGGTAINLFIQNMPRLSVDIDLTYLPLESRETTFANIHNALQQLAHLIQQRMPTVKVHAVQTTPPQPLKQLICQKGLVQIKIEVNTVIRGTLLPPEIRPLCQRAQDTFARFIEMTVLSEPDLYGGKICAALDRQHPRDLFDMYLFFHTTPTINGQLKKAVLFYLLSHNRPLSELLNPSYKNLEILYKNSFEGMSDQTVVLYDLHQTRDQLVMAVNESLTQEDKSFLLSFKQGKPLWNSVGMENLETYPSIQWKLKNICTMAPEKHKLATTKLKNVLEQHESTH